MSAFILGNDHIDYLVTAAIDLGTGAGGFAVYWQPEHGGHVRLGLDNADEFGAMLMRENIASVQYRYNDTEYADLPGPNITPFASEYEYRRFANFCGHEMDTITQVFAALRCYEYQSCEHPGWETSQAKRVCESIRHGYIYRLPGTDEAQWEVTRPRVMAAH